jgi:hypothetical protein
MIVEGRHQAAQKELALRIEAWQQAVQRQREVSDLASERLRAVSVKQCEVLRVLVETSHKPELANGKPGFRPIPDATPKPEEAMKEIDRAFKEINQAIEKDFAEREKLFRLQRERPYR